MSEERFILAPASIPQQQFLSSNATVTLYAGTMGAGKSFAIVLNMVKFAAMQNSTIVCYRRTQPEIKAPGGIWQEAVPIFKKMFPDCKVRGRECEIYIPSTNSVVKFQGLQYQSDVDKALGSQFSAIFFDEAVTFSPFDQFILPLLGRLRSGKTAYAPQMFWTTNPRYGHGIYEWIKDFYLDDFGIPLKEKSNIKRWFVLVENKPVWFDTEESALEYCDTLPSHGGVKVRPLTFTAIRAHVTDNEPLTRANPQYIANLQALPEIKRRIYLDGSWTAREEEAGLFLRSMVKVVPYPNMKAKKRCRSWDLASSPVSTQTKDPDWSRGVLVSREDNGVYTVEDIAGARDRPHVIENLIYNTALADKEFYGRVTYSIPLDPGQAGVARGNEIKRKLAELGIECYLIRPSTAKRTRFLPFSAISEAGFVNVVKADWNDTFYDELEAFSGLKRGERDDIVDCCSDAILTLNKQIQLPEFSLPDLSSGPTLSLPTTGSIPISGLTIPTNTYR